MSPRYWYQLASNAMSRPSSSLAWILPNGRSASSCLLAPGVSRSTTSRFASVASNSPAGAGPAVPAAFAAAAPSSSAPTLASARSHCFMFRPILSLHVGGCGAFAQAVRAGARAFADIPVGPQQRHSLPFLPTGLNM